MMRGLLTIALVAGCASTGGVTREEEAHLARCVSTRRLCDESHKPNYREMCAERVRQRYAFLQGEDRRQQWLAERGCPYPGGRSYSGSSESDAPTRF